MIDALRTGLTGLVAAETSAAARAQNIVNAQTPGYRPVEPVLRSSDGGVRASVRERPLSPGAALALEEGALPPVSLAEELVQLKVAEIAYKASAAVVRTAGRLGDAALDIID